MPVPNMPNLRRTYQAPSSLNGSSGINSSVVSSNASSPFSNFRGGNVGHFSHAGSPGPSPSIYASINKEIVSPVASAPVQAPAHPPISAVPGKYNGYADLPNQVYRRTVRRGFALNIIVVGETGTGKSTFINSLFSSDIYDGKESLGISNRIGQTIQVEKTRVTLMEKGVQVRLTIVDVPGFGHYVDNSNTWESVVAYIDKRYHEYLEREMSIKRDLEAYSDDRIHCCLYFIAPNGHGLRPLDIQAMKALGTKVNIIPVIGRADTLTSDECKDFKEKIRRELKENDIKLYDFPAENENEAEEDEHDNKRNGHHKDGDDGKKTTANAILPFAVIGSTATVETRDGRKVRGRKYPWGTVEIDNPDHCDFVVLRRLLLRVHLSDLMDVTNDVHYENYRVQYFGRLGGRNAIEQRSPLSQLETEKKDSEVRINKMKNEMQTIFDQKVREKIRKLEDTDKDLERKYSNWDKEWEAQRKKLEQDRADYELMKKQLGEIYPQLYSILQDELLRSSNQTDAHSGGGGSPIAHMKPLKPNKSKSSFLQKNFM